MGRRRAQDDYTPPTEVQVRRLGELIAGTDRPLTKRAKRTLLPGLGGEQESGPWVYCAGELALAQQPAIAVVGSRKANEAGLRLAADVARALVAAGVVVVSGLAEGVDVAAHRAALEAGGRTIAVIGTPLERAYPREHASLQERIYLEHLLVSPFPHGYPTTPKSFPQRNRTMAAMSDATVIIAASETSGTVHQAAECAQLGRWLLFSRAVVEDPRLEWPAKFLKPGERVGVFDDVAEIVATVRPR